MKKLIFSILTAAMLTGSTLHATDANNTYNPFEEIRKIQQQMDKVFNRLHQQFLQGRAFSDFGNTFIKTPAADILDKGDHYLIQADLPGADKKSIHVTEKEGILKIEARTVQEKKEKSDNYIRQERFVGAFAKVLTLPKDADASKLSTKYTNGVLEITIPKRR